MKLVFIFLFFLLIAAGNIVAQPQAIKIDVVGISLNKVLLELRDKYGFQFAYNENLLSQYLVTATREFKSKEEVLNFLIEGLPLSVEKSGSVFMLIPKAQKKVDSKYKLHTQIKGQVLENGTLEPLPFSYVVINNKQVQSGQNGHFSFLASADTTFNMTISHLGYFIYDTVFTSGLNQKFLLTPSVTELGEVKVLSNLIEKSTLIGDKPGKMKLNNTIAPFLPGYGDNSVFNLIRLMPGILASGEQSADLLIWGSYESHSKVEFDGFTLFGLKNFNDNIGVVNPLILKNVEVLKGGYEAKYGDRVGGIVNISGKNGSLQKPSFTFNINNTTLNTMVEIPVSKKVSLLAAYRQTYYELYDPSELRLFNRSGKNPNGIEFTLVPDYQFKDANLKYSWHNKNNSISVSTYIGGDRYYYDLKSDVNNTRISRNEEEENKQYAGAFSFNHNWQNGNSSLLTASYSTFKNTSNELNKTTNIRNGFEKILRIGLGENTVNQLTLSQENQLNFLNGHNLEFGFGFESNEVLLLRQLFAKDLINMNTNSQRVFSYVQDNLPVNKILELKAGLRANYLFNLNAFFIEPRLSASMSINNYIKFNASWGLYHQFLAKTSLVDSTRNYYYYFWANANNTTIPALRGEHWVGGLSYNKNNFTFSAEGYYKTTTGLSRFVNGTNKLPAGFYTGEGRSYGLDLYVKKELKKHLAWISYTLSKTEEHFPFYIREYYRAAPHDQRHELKFAGILNFKSFYFSANYIYGSGFEKFEITNDNGETFVPAYNRIDAALIYKFKPGKVNGEIGLSVLNVLNTENIKFSNLRRIVIDNQDPLDVHAEAIPFTPTIFLKMKF